MMKGAIIHTDRFGNLVTNFTAEHLTLERMSTVQGSRERPGDPQRADPLRRSGRKTAVCIFRLAGLSGDRRAKGSAARTLEARRGMEVDLAFPVV